MTTAIAVFAVGWFALAFLIVVFVRSAAVGDDQWARAREERRP